MAATAARGQFGDGSSPKFAHYILVYLCAKIGAFIKKCTIGLNIIGKPPHYYQFITLTVHTCVQHGMGLSAPVRQRGSGDLLLVCWLTPLQVLRTL